MSNDFKCSVCGCLFKTSEKGFVSSFDIKNGRNENLNEKDRTWICEKCYPGLGEGEKKKFILMQKWEKRGRT